MLHQFEWLNSSTAHRVYCIPTSNYPTNTMCCRCCDEHGTAMSAPYKRVMMFVDNSGADIVLGMLPLARELLRMGCEVIMVANSLPAINDITAPELRTLLSAASQHCPIIRRACQAAGQVLQITGGRVPPYPGLRRQRSPSFSMHDLGQALPAGHRCSGSSASGILGCRPSEEGHAPGVRVSQQHRGSSSSGHLAESHVGTRFSNEYDYDQVRTMTSI